MSARPTHKTAVVLFNLGGPDTPEAVEPFLFNLFNDKAIIGAPGIIRKFLARFISKKRGPEAREIYAHIGGGSPLLSETQAQAAALSDVLSGIKWPQGVHKIAYKVFISMRYWHPMAYETIQQVKAYEPERIILLPLYPQFSTTTTESSYDEWMRLAKKQKLDVPTHLVCCYPTETDFIASHVEKLEEAYDRVRTHGVPRILFSAHGLPQKIVDGGDPYQWQVEQTAKLIMDNFGHKDTPWRVCYQSKVGPLAWIKPSTEDEIAEAGKDRVPIIVLPIAFVSEHSETLVELDIEYRQLAEKSGVKAYERVPALGAHPRFVDSLATICQNIDRSAHVQSNVGERICPPQCGRCINQQRIDVSF